MTTLGRPGEVVGDGVLLAAWTDDDVPDVLALADDDATRAWSPSLRPVRTASDARAWLASRTENPARCDWAVRDPATGRLIGRVGLHRFEPIGRSAEIGYGVHPAHRRGGVARRAVSAATDYGFRTLGLVRVGLVHATGNLGSCAVARSSGYAFEGTMRSVLDHGDGVLHDVHLHARLVGDPPGPAAAAPVPLTPAEVPLGDLLLRPWQPDDAPALLAALGDPLIQRWHHPVARDLAACEAWIAHRTDDWARGTVARWAVVTSAGDLAGAATLRGIDRSAGRAVVGYWVAPAHRRRRVATRVLGALSSYAFDLLDVHRLELFHALADEASCGVAETAGFALEGTTRGSDRLASGWVDEHLHARLAGDPVGSARAAGG